MSRRKATATATQFVRSRSILHYFLITPVLTTSTVSKRTASMVIWSIISHYFLQSIVRYGHCNSLPSSSLSLSLSTTQCVKDRMLSCVVEVCRKRGTEHADAVQVGAFPRDYWTFREALWNSDTGGTNHKIIHHASNNERARPFLVFTRLIKRWMIC